MVGLVGGGGLVLSSVKSCQNCNKIDRGVVSRKSNYYSGETLIHMVKLITRAELSLALQMRASQMKCAEYDGIQSHHFPVSPG